MKHSLITLAAALSFTPLICSPVIVSSAEADCDEVCDVFAEGTLPFGDEFYG